MKRFVELSCYTTYDDDYNLVVHLTLKDGEFSLSFDINNKVRLQILEFFAAPNKHNKLNIELKELFCPTIRVDGKYVYLPTEVEEAMDTFGVKKGYSIIQEKEDA